MFGREKIVHLSPYGRLKNRVEDRREQKKGGGVCKTRAGCTERKLGESVLKRRIDVEGYDNWWGGGKKGQDVRTEQE